MLNTIQVSYQSTRNAYTANQYLSTISQFDTIAWDFEVAVRYTPEQILEWKAHLESNPELPKLERMQLLAQINASALGHPYHCTITHCSIATSESEAFVFVLDNKQITNRVLNYLINSNQLQVLHNASYDFRHLMYHTNRIPSRFEDTQVFAKTLINHVEVHQANTKLKHLASRWYGGDWSLSADDFTLSRMYDEDMIRYAATDACATYKLWTYLNEQVNQLDNQPPIDWEAPY